MKKYIVSMDIYRYSRNRIILNIKGEIIDIIHTLPPHKINIMSSRKKKRRTSLAARVASASSQGKASRKSVVQLAIETNTIDNINEDTGIAVIHQACSGPSETAANLILQLANAGANLNLQDVGGDTPLHFAALAGNVQAIDTLLKFQVDGNIKNNRGKTPLDVARDEGEEEIVNLLKTL